MMDLDRATQWMFFLLALTLLIFVSGGMVAFIITAVKCGL